MDFMSWHLIACVNLLLIYMALSSSYKIRNVTAAGGVLLESPQWSVQENALYWVDVYKQKLFRMDEKTGEVTTRDVYYGPTNLIVPVRHHPGYVVVSIRTSLYLLKWGAPEGDLSMRQLTTVDRGKPDNSIDDGKVDAKGRLWFGTFGKIDFNLSTSVVVDQGTLYSIDDRNYAEPAIKKRPVSMSNGIAWALDNRKMYYNDSPERRVAAFDFDLERGAIANETTLFDFNEHCIPGIPDGMTIEADGNLWVATFHGQRILVIDSKSGKLLNQIRLPVDLVTSVMWVGPDLSILFVTTGRFGVATPKTLSGAMFTITNLGTKGVPENQFEFRDASSY